MLVLKVFRIEEEEKEKIFLENFRFMFGKYFSNFDDSKVPPHLYSDEFWKILFNNYSNVGPVREMLKYSILMFIHNFETKLQTPENKLTSYNQNEQKRNREMKLLVSADR